MQTTFPITKCFLLACFISSAFCSKAQYTELASFRKDSVFIPFGTVAGVNVPAKLKLIPSNFYTSQFGFFCRQELKLEKSTSIPLKFRIGSVLATDRLEGKPNTRFAGQ